jgi:hypothetical protein
VGKRVWVSGVKDLLYSIGLNYTWNDPYLSCTPQYVRTLLLDQHVQRLHAEMFNDNVKHGTGNKLRTFREFSDLQHCEEYLITVKKFEHRKALSRLRTNDKLYATLELSKTSAIFYVNVQSILTYARNYTILLQRRYQVLRILTYRINWVFFYSPEVRWQCTSHIMCTIVLITENRFYLSRLSRLCLYLE